MFVFIILMIPATFHYRGVAVHAANQTIWENCTKLSKSVTDSQVLLQHIFQ